MTEREVLRSALREKFHGLIYEDEDEEHEAVIDAVLAAGFQRPATKVEIDHIEGGWHQWVFLGGWRDYPATVRRDAIGRKHPTARREWLVIECNNTECSARGIVRLDGIIDAMQTAHPVPIEGESQ